MAPSVRLHIGDGASVQIAGRSGGGLTGTRTALVLARIPVEATVARVLPVIRPHGIPIGEGRYVNVATYVDNFYVVAPSPAAAVLCLEKIETILVAQWGLEIKHASRQLLVATAGGSAPSAGTERWPVVKTMACLGHELASNGSVVPCWHNARKAMLTSHYKNSGNVAALDLPWERKMTLLSRATLLVVAYRAARWPPSAAVISYVDRFQRRIVASCLATPPRPDEPLIDFYRRRNATVTANLPASKKWSRVWCRKVVEWDDLLNRGHDPMSWSRDLLLAAAPRDVRRVHAGRPTTRGGKGSPRLSASCASPRVPCPTLVALSNSFPAAAVSTMVCLSQ
jgi:hypothetical protein